MEPYVDVVINRSGTAIQGASVNVYLASDGVTPATLYSDDGVTATDNPLTTDANGRFTFYAADGNYKLVISAAAITTYNQTIQLSSHAPDVFDVKVYGAKGDGVTDDTTAIQAAITACQDANGGRVYIPSGEYQISKQSGQDYCLKIDLSETAGKTIQFSGEGRYSSRINCVFEAGDTTTDGLYCSCYRTASGEYPIVLRDFQLNWYYANPATGQNGIVLEDSGYSEVSNVRVLNFGGGAGIKVCASASDRKGFSNSFIVSKAFFPALSPSIAP